MCVDVGLSMSNSAPGEESPFELAKKVIQKFVQRQVRVHIYRIKHSREAVTSNTCSPPLCQVFSETKVDLALVLFGTDATDNPLSQDGQYEHIRVHRHLLVPDCDLLVEIENQIQPENQQADCILPPSLNTFLLMPHKTSSNMQKVMSPPSFLYIGEMRNRCSDEASPKSRWVT